MKMTSLEVANALAGAVRATADKMNELEKCRVMFAEFLATLCLPQNRDVLLDPVRFAQHVPKVFEYIDSVRARYEALDK